MKTVDVLITIFWVIMVICTLILIFYAKKTGDLDKQSMREYECFQSRGEPVMTKLESGAIVYSTCAY